MNSLVTRLSRAAMMGLAWAAVWTPIGMLLGARIVGELEPEHIGGPLYASFICGTVFSGLGGMASGRRRLAEMSSSHAAAWGAASGVFVGMLLFVVGEGDIDRYQPEWTLAVVATSSIAAAIAAGQRRWGWLSPFRAAVLVAVITGLPAGALPVFLSSPDSREWFPLVAVMGALSLLSAFSALVSPSVARWWKKQNSAASPAVL